MNNGIHSRSEGQEKATNAITKPIRTRWQVLALQYLGHLVFLLPAAMLIGFIPDMFVDRYYYTTGFRQLALCAIVTAGIAGFIVTLFRRNVAAFFVWVPPLFFVLYVGYLLNTRWDAAWAGPSRLQYVLNSLFGPNCTTQECIYTIPGDVFLSSIAYSIGAAIAWGIIKLRSTAT